MTNFKIKLDRVMQVYSGKPGCMCGCLGTYRVASAHLKAADLNRGYDHDPSDVNDRQVRRVVKILETRAAQVGTTFINVVKADKTVIVTAEYIFAEVDGRYYAAYFVPAQADLDDAIARRAARELSKANRT